MSKVHIAKQGFVTKSAIPSVSRIFSSDASLLLLGSGTNGQTTFTDSSVNNFAITRVGDTVISTAQFPTGMSSSILFDGTGDWLTLTKNSTLNFGANNFSWEAYIYRNNSNDCVLYTDRPTTSIINDGVMFGIVSNRVFILATNNGTSWTTNTYSTPTGNTVATGSWVHIAIVRNGNTCFVYINGTQSYSVAMSGTLRQNQTTAYVGSDSFSGGGSVPSLNGYMSNLRIINNYAQYTTNFTPPALPLSSTASVPVNVLLLGSGSNGSTSITDNSLYNNTVTRFANGSGQPVISTAQFPTGMSSSIFMGSASPYGYLQLTTSNQFIGTNPFTIEGYVYLLNTTGGGGQELGFIRLNTNGAVGFFTFGIQFARFFAYDTTVGKFIDVSGTSVPLNQWAHIAFVRSSTSTNGCVIYLNGTQIGQGTSASNYGTITTFQIGDASTYPWNGYISNYRVTLGRAIYTSNFTPPPLPLSNEVTIGTTITNNIYGVYQNY